ncbi:MAG: radical SAM protein [Chitinispirillaceae bacterium]|nr:radical SAM protein [Chitinispirillaceae bacterium]
MTAKTLSQRINLRASARNIPLSAVVEVTYRCNLRCYFCYQKHFTKTGRDELGLSAWSSLFSQLADAGTLYLTVTGGEPFVRKDILGIIAAARECGIAVSVITNGTLLTRSIARRLAALQIMDVGVSLHAASAAQHDRLTGCTGSFAGALRGIRFLSSTGTRVMVKHTVSSINFGQYRPIRDLAEKMGCLFECDSFVVPSLPERRSPFALSVAQHAQFAHDMGATAAFDDGAAHLHCDAGRSVAGITPSGDLMPCIQLPVRFGSLQDAPFASLWHGAAARSFRKKEKRLCDECERCGKRAWCSRCHGLAYVESGDFRGASRSCCARAEAVREIALRTGPG